MSRTQAAASDIKATSSPATAEKRAWCPKNAQAGAFVVTWAALSITVFPRPT
jgi:hypothetical protein